jgi:hypothetical protein
MLFAGVAKIQTEDYDQAVQWLRRTNPDSPWAYFHLGAALHSSGTAEARMETKPGFCLIPPSRPSGIDLSRLAIIGDIRPIANGQSRPCWRRAFLKVGKYRGRRAHEGL